MKTRQVFISGEEYTCPERIQRIDMARGTHGWQLRYGRPTLFSDTKYGGTSGALATAIKELIVRLKANPVNSASRMLRKHPQVNKSHRSVELIPGVFGPIRQERSVGPNRNRLVVSYTFSVYLPQFDAKTGENKSAMKTVYIASDNTYTNAKERAALNKAVALRDAGLDKYRAEREKHDKKVNKQDLTQLRKLLAIGSVRGDTHVGP